MDTFERQGLRFDVRDGGPRDGAVVVLLHGFPQDASSWREVEPVLHEAGLRTLAPDQRGYSPAASPSGTEAYTITELVDDVVALMDEAGADQVALVGHDWGGAVAWAAATLHPQRVATLTVLSTPHPAALRRANRRPSQWLRGWYRTFFQLPRIPERLLAGRVGAMMQRDQVPGAEAYGRRFASPESLHGPITWYRANRGLGADVMDQPVRVPTTYVWGSHDTALRRRAAELTREYVAAEYRFVELDADHWLPDKEPSRVAAEIISRSTEHPV